MVDSCRLGGNDKWMSSCRDSDRKVQSANNKEIITVRIGTYESYHSGLTGNESANSTPI